MSQRTKFPDKKVDRLQLLESLVNESSAIYLAEYIGMDVEKINALRDLFHENGVKIRVAKNTMMKLALNNAGIKELDPYMDGPNIFAFGADDPAAPAKLISKFAKVNERPQLKSCIFEGRLYGPDKIEAIKDLPTRDEAIALLIGQIQAPVSQFVGLLNEIIRSFLGVLDSIIQEKGGEPA